MWTTVGRFVVRRAVTFAQHQQTRQRQRKDGDSGGSGWLRWLLVIAGAGVGLFIAMVMMVLTAVFNEGGSASAACGATGRQALGQSYTGDGSQGVAAPGSTARRPTGRQALGQSYTGTDWEDKVLTPEQIAQFAAGAGFRGDDLWRAVAVALAESSGDVDATNHNDNGTTDYGLWQINSVHSAWFDTSKAFEPAYNATAARRVFLNAGSSWTPWVAYNSGAYRDHHLAALEAVRSLPEASASASEVNAFVAACGTPPASGSTWAEILQRRYPAAIDPYYVRDPSPGCRGGATPGASAFADMLLAAYPVSGMGGITRDCGVGGVSEHKEGRAFDWMVDVSNPEQRAAAEAVIGTLLATDEHGNTHALFRRFGLKYIIWNRQIFSAARASQGWRTYHCDGSPGSCHTNHVHFSFTWQGARQQTSAWAAQPAVGRSPRDAVD